MTSDAEQKILNKAYGSIPPVKAAQAGRRVRPRPTLTVLRDTLAKSAAPLPQVADESQFETAVGTAVKDLFADAAAGTRGHHRVGQGASWPRPSSRCRAVSAAP